MLLARIDIDMNANHPVLGPVVLIIFIGLIALFVWSGSDTANRRSNRRYKEKQQRERDRKEAEEASRLEALRKQNQEREAKRERERQAKWEAERPEREAQAAREEAERADHERLRREQQKRDDRHSAENLYAEAIDKIAELILSVRSAYSTLDETHRHYSATAFAPFWVSCKQSEKDIDVVARNAIALYDCAKRYATLVNTTEAELPPFLNLVPFLDVAASTVGSLHDELSTIMYEGERRYEFADILQQMKTRQELQKGFSSVVHGLDTVRQTLMVSTAIITNSINDLNRTIVDQSSYTRGVIAQSQNDMRQASAAANGEMSLAMRQHGETSKKQLHVLQSIKRRM
ncbi:hypothetical protein [Williamsia sterculiae]|uniref:Uncharacterized protein n=1 Tax=Williamsia sterculiae TaxID=1344003 RepID=A0A1N7GH34_9NOCA|nr:hypothetical protein [Williamsia sterculiae]SIS11904.1 hypothetical protein SAMN05445060_2780 [Williamsia sterculiae]